VNQADQIAEDVALIRKDIDKILHGNGRRGLWALSDAVFGPNGRPDDGLQKRMQTLEDRGKEARFLQRGIAVGMALMAADSLLGLNLAALVARFFGQ
jgi:hypothetical protein